MGQRAGPSTRGVQLRSIRLEEVSRSEVVEVQPDESITDVVVRMADEDVGCVVVTEDGEPIGILTDRKVALSMANQPDVADRTAGDLVDGGIVSATEDTTVYEAIQRLRDEGIRRLPIVDDDGNLQGIVTLDDLLVLVAGELGAIAEVIESQAPPR
jgi:CBS domain-containing protein